MSSKRRGYGTHKVKSVAMPKSDLAHTEIHAAIYTETHNYRTDSSPLKVSQTADVVPILIG